MYVLIGENVGIHLLIQNVMKTPLDPRGRNLSQGLSSKRKKYPFFTTLEVKINLISV